MSRLKLLASMAFIACLALPTIASADSLGSVVGGSAGNQSNLSGGLCQGSPISLSNGQQASLLIDCTTHALITEGSGGGGAITANQGTAGAVTAGWPVINGEPADATGTFTNGTQTGNVTTAGIDGYGTALITINGTYGTATATFLASDNNGVTFYPIACSQTDGSSISETGYTGLTNTNRAWLCPAQGFDTIRVLSSAVASGTVNVRVSQTSAPTTAATVQSTSESPALRTLVTLDVKTVTTGGTAVTAIAAGNRTAGGFIQNPPSATVNLCINEIGAASGTTSSGDTTCIVPGQSYAVAPASTAVSVISSDSTHPFSGYGLK